MEQPPEENANSSGESGNELESARIQGDIVQARNISGGIHFHGVQDDHKGAGVVPRQLPADVSAFVNRKPELRELSRLVGPQAPEPAARSRRAAASVVVITGSAGVGKTALALHWAHMIRDRFPDGEIYANLRGYDEGPPVGAGVVLDRILRDMGIRPSGIPQDLEGRAGLFRTLVAG
jgi:hypothetical protein